MLTGLASLWYAACLRFCKCEDGCASVQDARTSSAGSPQILGSGLTRETSAASSELSAATDAEAEIRRLTEVGCTIPASPLTSTGQPYQVKKTPGASLRFPCTA